MEGISCFSLNFGNVWQTFLCQKFRRILKGKSFFFFLEMCFSSTQGFLKTKITFRFHNILTETFWRQNKNNRQIDKQNKRKESNKKKKKKKKISENKGDKDEDEE